MKLILIHDKCVYHGDDDHFFNSDGYLVINDIVYGDGSESNVTVHQDVTVPDDYLDNKYIYRNGEFSYSVDYISACERTRQKRNELLKETDWWAVSDRTMTQDQIEYRQSLRDITSVSTFPNIPTPLWPTKPE